MKTTASSGPFGLNLRDFLKGLIVAVGTPVLYLVQELIPNWPLTPIEKAALSAFVSYLLKNFFTPTQLIVSNPPKAAVDAIKSGEAEVSVTPT